MYQYIHAEEKHLDQIVPLIASTGYWEAGLRRNNLNLPVHQFIREYIAKPYLPFTTIIAPKNNKNLAIGILICGAKNELDNSTIDYSTHIPSEVKHLFKNLFTFTTENNFHIACLAINHTYRKQGLGISLFNLAENKWKESQFDTISLYTFSCQTNAMKLYLKVGMMVTRIFSVDDLVPSPCVLYFEKNAHTEGLHNYFESHAYQKLTF